TETAAHPQTAPTENAAPSNPESSPPDWPAPFPLRLGPISSRSSYRHALSATQPASRPALSRPGRPTPAPFRIAPSTSSACPPQIETAPETTPASPAKDRTATRHTLFLQARPERRRERGY